MNMVHKVNLIKNPIITIIIIILQGYVALYSTALYCMLFAINICKYIYSKKPQARMLTIYSKGLSEPWGELVFITTKHQLIPLHLPPETKN